MSPRSGYQEGMNTVRVFHSMGVAAAVAAMATQGATAQEHEVRLRTRVAPGDRFTIKSECVEGVQINRTVGGVAEPAQSIGLRGTLEGTVQVVEVNEHAEVTRATITISAFTYESNRGADSMDAGAVIDVTRDGSDLKFSTTEGEVSDSVLERVLTLMVEMPSGDPTIHDLYETDRALAVGASIPLHADVAVKDLADDGITGDPSNISGSLTVKGETDHGTLPCVEYICTISAKDLVLPASQVPAGMSVSSARSESAVRLLSPRDPTLPIALIETDAMQELAIRGRQGPDLVLVEMRQVARRQVKREFTRL